MTFQQTLLIGLIAAIVGYILQQRAWAHRAIEETRQREFEECVRVIDELSKSVDKRISATLHFKTLVDRKAVESSDYEEFRLALIDWMNNFSSNKSKIYLYFGKEQMLEFENRVHASLWETSSILTRTHRYDYSNLSSDHKLEHDKVTGKINVARYISFKFLQELNERLSNGEIGNTKLVNNVHAGSLKHISRLYLIYRLFGLKV